MFINTHCWNEIKLMKHDESDGLILCEWHSQGYDPFIFIMFIFGLAKNDIKWLP
jgi:hypothetical protein